MRSRKLLPNESSNSNSLLLFLQWPSVLQCLDPVVIEREIPVPTRKQITVFLENKPGRLAHVLSELAEHKINIVALSVMDRHEHGVLRLVTDDVAETLR